MTYVYIYIYVVLPLRAIITVYRVKVTFKISNSWDYASLGEIQEEGESKFLCRIENLWA